MSRSGYSDDIDDDLETGRWLGRLKSAMNGRRGQALLVEMRDALDEMPVKELIDGALVKDGAVCALGAVAVRRGLDVSGVDPENVGHVARVFDISETLACEIAYQNDDEFSASRTPAKRWQDMRYWVDRNLRQIEAIVRRTAT